MHTAPTPELRDPQAHRPWYEGMNRYHWTVLATGALAWLFDTMDQRIFVLCRQPAVAQLLGTHETDPEVLAKGQIVTAVMLVGWAVGGLLFGVLGDKWGRVKTLSVSILVYSMFTGLSGLSQHWYDFAAYRFLMGCGVGGAFATAATLIAETLPSHSRAFALGMFQALSAVGNITGSLVAAVWLKPGVDIEIFGYHLPGWRLLFFFGVLPAILVVFIMRSIREPDAWLAARAAHKDQHGKQGMGGFGGIWAHPTWRRNMLVGVTLATAGVVGVWGVAFYSPELIKETLSGASKEHVSRVRGFATLWQDVGAFFGMFAFTILATRVGRKVSFALSLIIAYAALCFVFIQLDQEREIYWMTTLVGFVSLSVFGGYAIYFPEIFPTRLRSTGTGICYNSARVIAALLIIFAAQITNALQSMFGGIQGISPLRLGAILLCTAYLFGLIALIWAPETKGKPLPED